MRDYLVAYLIRRRSEIPTTYTSQTDKTDETLPNQVLSVLSVPEGRCIQKTGEGSVSFVSNQVVGYPKNTNENQKNNGELISTDTYCGQLTKLTEPPARIVRSPKKQKGKVWRRAPYWRACAAATRNADGTHNLEATDLLFAALALRGGHTPNDTIEMLRRVSPLSSTAPDYCTTAIQQAQANPPLQITQERAERYVAAHPFAWEQQLNAAELAGVQVLEGVQ